MATVDDVRRTALALPHTTEGLTHGNLAWRVAGSLFAWERPLRRADIAALGDRVPDGPVYAVHTGDEGAKLALIADDPVVYFTTPHFDGHPAVLFELGRIEVGELTELITDAWLARAPRKLAADFLSSR